MRGDRPNFIEYHFKEAWTKFVAENEDLFQGFDASKLSLHLFHQSYLACYEPIPMGKAKLLWGYSLWNRESEKNSPSFTIECEQAVERHELQLDFPKNAKNILLKFYESVKTTETTSEDLEAAITVGPFIDINTV